MGESSTCFRRSFSQPSSPTSIEEKQGNPLQWALTTSVSFGRFMSEQLDWEKWSAFTHNRYLEDVEKYSRPGSVAEKKAFFEAHYRRRRNAALVEQQNAVTSNFSESYITNKAIEETKGIDVRNRELVSSVVTNGCISTGNERKLEDAPTGGAENATEPPVLTEKLVELSIQLENNGYVGNIKPNEEDKACSKVAATTRDSASSGKKKPAFSSSKLSTNGGASKLVPPVKPAMAVQHRKNNRTTVNSNTALNSVHKKSLAATSLHMSVKFASGAGETKKVSSVELEKIVNSRLIRTPVKISTESALQQTSTRASVDGILKRHSVTPQAEKRRTITQHGNSISGSRTVTGKVQPPNLTYSKSSSTWGSKARFPTVSSSFSFKSEERAAKRKEFFQKLEPKLNTKEAGKKQLQSKLQVTAAGDDKDLRHSTSFYATPNAKVFHKTESQCNLKKKIPTVTPCSPKFQGKEASKVQSIDSRPPWRLSVKMGDPKNVTGQNSRPQVNASKLCAKKSMHENMSPNIQL
ncbi:TPX2 domain-containing protein [Abeliophyllum distichum]|uniref:TPX2 domain-containing protein n=1 Tax=Abeliophyllum distichum TaxID=126358 RepID=A0ABD1U3T9_9LAMI